MRPKAAFKDEVQALCDEFSIEIVPAHVIPKPGQTRAPGNIGYIIARYGMAHARLVLSTLAETKGNDGLIDEYSLWAASDLILACQSFVDTQTSDWLEAWDKLPLGDLMLLANELRGVCKQRGALAGMIYLMLSKHMKVLPSNKPAESSLIRKVFGRKMLYPHQQIEAGKRLLEMKALLPRGHFGPWLQDEAKINKSTAQKYMRRAREASQQPV